MHFLSSSTILVTSCTRQKRNRSGSPTLKSSKEFGAHAQLKNLIGEHHEDRGLIEKAQFTLFTDNQDEFIASGRKVILLISGTRARGRG